MAEAKRKDSNTDEIMVAVLECGWKFLDTHNFGMGFPDCIAYKFINNLPVSVLIEIKTEKGRLTKHEIMFHGRNEGLVYICRNAKDVKDTLSLFEHNAR